MQYAYLATAALSVSMVLIGAAACIWGADYGVGLMLLLAIVVPTILFMVHGKWIDRLIDDAHHKIVVDHPRVLKLVPLRVANLQARQERAYQKQVDNYLTALAQLIQGDRCTACGSQNRMMRIYPHDPHFHDRDCAVVKGFQQFGNVELCPYGKLFELPQPVLLGRLDDDRKRGLQYFAYQEAVSRGYGTKDYFCAVGTEYLRSMASQQDEGFLERLGRKVAEECGIEALLLQESNR
jgi:hypothetical protein